MKAYWLLEDGDTVQRGDEFLYASDDAHEWRKTPCPGHTIDNSYLPHRRPMPAQGWPEPVSVNKCTPLGDDLCLLWCPNGHVDPNRGTWATFHESYVRQLSKGLWLPLPPPPVPKRAWEQAWENASASTLVEAFKAGYEAATKAKQ